MTVDLKKARELCTQPEFALVTSTAAASLRSLTPRALRMKLVRARGLRDKFRDLADRQAREARGKALPRGRRPARQNRRTVEKAELFGEVLRRLEERAAQLDLPAGAPGTSSPARGRRRATASRAPASRAPAARTPEKPRRKRPARTVRRGHTREDASDARKERKLMISHVPRKQSHVSSRNRRRQARRDAR
jgi:hypothetical protein